MRILFFVSSLNAGGAERVATTLSNAWAERGDEVILVPTYLTKHASFYPLDDAVKQIWLADCPGRRLRRVLPGLGKWLTIRRLIRRTRPDVVVSFLTNVNVNVLIAAAGLSVPVVVSERTNPVHSRSAGRVLRLLRRLTYWRARVVVLQTQASVAPFRALLPGMRDVAVVPNPLPPDLSVDAAPSEGSFQGLAVQRRHIAAMGRLVAIKQFDVLIDAFAQLAGKYPDWDLIIWGEGPLRETLMRAIEITGLQDRVVLAGSTQQPWQALSRASMFAMTSRVEGFPNVLLEAMALGLPCVVLDCPSGPAELTRNGQDALLVPLNEPGALVDALERLLSDAGLRQKLGRRAAVQVRQRYGLLQILAQWDDVFARAAAHKTKGAP